MKRENHLQLGFSFGSMIKEIEYIGEVLQYQPDLLEIPYTDPKIYQMITEFTAKYSLKLGLHLPSFYSLDILPYEITGPTMEGINRNLDFIDGILREEYHDLEYMILHFPTIFPDVPDGRINDLLNRILSRIAAMQEIYSVPILLENVTVNSSFQKPEDYRFILSSFNSIGLCLDIGHAHLVDNHSVFDFFGQLKNQIQVIHLYNTPRNSIHYYYRGRHYPFQDYRDGAGGEWMDCAVVVKSITELPNLKYVILEPDRELYQRFASPGDYHWIKRGKNL